MTRSTPLLLLTLSAAALDAAQPPEKCPEEPRIVTELGTREQVPADFTPAPGGGADLYPVPAQSGARYLRVRFSVSGSPDCAWYFTARDSAHRPIQVFGPENFTTGPSRWTHRIGGEQAAFDLQPCADGRRPSIAFEEYIWMPSAAKATYYSTQVQGAANFQPIAEADSSIRRFGDSVGFLMTSFGRRSWACSGVMLTPDLFLTNWHCGAPPGTPDAGYWNGDVLRDTLIDLSFDDDGQSREMEVAALVMRHKALDFALLRTTPIDARGPVRPVRLGTDPGADAKSIVVHHPAGETKRFSTVDCVVTAPSYRGWEEAASETEFKHRCDTEAGSSGAPVLNQAGELVGLHHLGFDYDAQRCEYRDRENKAVKISRILDAIRAQAKNVFDEIMRWQ